MLRSALAVLGLSILSIGAVCLASASPTAPSPALGPGAVLEMHKQLFAAIDKGDADKAASFVADATGGQEQPVTAFLIDENGKPVQAEGKAGMKDLVTKLAKASLDGGPEWTTTIVKSQADCAYAEVSYALLEFERNRAVKGGLKRYRSTSLVRYVYGAWKLWHWHVSPADEATATIAGGARK